MLTWGVMPDIRVGRAAVAVIYVLTFRCFYRVNADYVVT